MPARIIIGDRNGEKGLWISRPGRSATSTVDRDLLVSTTRLNLNPIMSGVITDPELARKSGDNPAPARYSGSSGYNPNTDHDGFVHYETRYKHNLGYVPIAFFNVGSAYAGEHYPQIYLTDNEVVLYHRMESLGRKANVTEFQRECTRYEWQDYVGYVCVAWKYNSKGNGWTRSDFPSSMKYKCNIHYILYKQKAQ